MIDRIAHTAVIRPDGTLVSVHEGPQVVVVGGRTGRIVQIRNGKYQVEFIQNRDSLLFEENELTPLGYFTQAQDTRLLPNTTVNIGEAHFYSLDPTAIPPWTYDGNNWVRAEDTRPLIRFTPDRVRLDVGEQPTAVSVEVVQPTGVTRNLFFDLDDHKLRVGVQNGTGSFLVTANEPKQLSINTGRDYRIETPLRVRVDVTEV